MTAASAPSVKSLAVRGAIWTIIGYGASQILRFGSNLILTRLLVPELFGLMSLVYVFITGLHLFSDVGLGISVIQNKRGDDPKFLNTAWTIQVMRGIVLWFGCLLIAAPAAQVYNEPRLQWLIPLVGLNTLITGFSGTSILTLNRHLSVRQLALYELSGQLISTVVMIIWAYFNPTIWALIAGSLASAVYQLICSHCMNKGFVNRFTWDRSSATELFSFGTWIFISTAITFFAEQADRLILGKVLSLELLGIYGIAMTLADLPRSVTLALNGKVILPALSKVIDQPRPVVRAKLLHNRKLMLLALVAVSVGLICFGDLVIKLLYDNRYIDAAWMLPILTLGIWPRLLCNTNEPALFAIGRPQYTSAANLSRFLCTAGGIFVGYALFQVPGAVVAVALNDLCYYVVVNFGLWREGLGGLRQDAFATGLMLAAAAMVLIIRANLGFGSPLDVLLAN
ncbi:MAG: oligosaccharide flippase family protein [Synechococcales cyanobacterium M58_A2018_015]|nr:oligosaccharide flippase family protein [Synechococcales cyanobacterium M58_A2018_015]